MGNRFVFTARNQAGGIITGNEEAENADVLISRLHLRGLTVTDVKVQTEQEAAVKPKAKVQFNKAHKFSHSRIKEDDLILFGRQLAIALSSGVSLLKSLDIILRQIDSKKLHNIIGNIVGGVESGLSFRDALAKYPKAFSTLWINMVETGEASGNLPIVLDRLAHYLEMRAAFKRKIVSAMIYPFILMLVACGAVAFFLFYIVPKFTEIFKSFDTTMPVPTQILIFVSAALRKNFLILFLVIGGIIFSVNKYIKTRRGKSLFDNFILRIPLFSEFFRLSEIEKFCSSMSTLLESGVPILYALEISESSSNNTVVQGIIRNVRDRVREGRPLMEPMEESGFFPPMVSQMVNMGEEIGELDKMFKKVSTLYSEILETQVIRFTAMFEPLMIVFMGLIIGSMVISMFLPIFEIANIGG